MDRLNELWPEFWSAALETLYMASFALVLGGILGLAIGIILYITRPGGLLQNRVVSVLVNLGVNFFRPIPFVIFMAVAQPFARLVVGRASAPRRARSSSGSRRRSRSAASWSSTRVGVARRDRGGAGDGAGPWRILFTVAIPESLGPLILGYTFIVVALIDMTAMAGLIGGGGLGAFAQIYGFRQFEPIVMWAAIILIVVFVHLVQLLGTRLARRIMRR